MKTQVLLSVEMRVNPQYYQLWSSFYTLDPQILFILEVKICTLTSFSLFFSLLVISNNHSTVYPMCLAFFLRFHICDSMQCFSLSSWFILLSIISFSFNHAATNGRFSFFFKAEWYFIVYIYSTFSVSTFYLLIHHPNTIQQIVKTSHFLYSCVHPWRLCCFHTVAIMNHVKIDMRLQISLPNNDFIFFRYIPEVRLLIHMLVLFLIS